MGLLLKRYKFLNSGLHQFLIFILLTLSSWNLTFAYSPYTNRELEELEKEFIQEINQSNSVLRDPLASQYINHLGKTLALNSQLPLPYFFIVKSGEINAFAGPGGYIGINSQLILVTGNESELAGVMAHEMAHVRLHHLYRMFEHQKQMRIPLLASMLASVALGAINPTLGSSALMASMGGLAQDSINFTRANEKEADRIGIDMLIKSGLNPQGMAGFFKKMQQATRYYYRDNIPAILRTHPLDEDRIAEAENRSLHLAKKSYPDSLDYRLFKELVRANTTRDNKQLLDYYQNQCKKSNHPSACQYGYVLALLNVNQYQPAIVKLQPLLQQQPENLYFATAMAQAEIGLKQFNNAVTRMAEMQTNNPENYAALVNYAESLLAAGRAEQAASILLKGSRQYKNDLPLCEQLAQAQAASNRKDYAYFTQAQCELLQGRSHSAVNQLKLAKTYAKNDKLLQARIEAKIEEIKYLAEK
jgi:predicted Zn-dependent protease